MKRCRILLFVAVCLGIPLSVSAQMGTPVIFTNDDGTFVFDRSTDVLTLGQVKFGTASLGNASDLTAISGLEGFGIANQALPFPNCTSTGCLGNLNLSTGALQSGNILQSAVFKPGGTISASYTGLTTMGGPANGTVSFTGTFSAASWTLNPGGGAWTFSGTIVNGQLMINGSNISIPGAVTVQLTLEGSGATNHPNKNAYTFSDSQGSTNFSVTPEPGTLALFGSGLIAVGFLTRRRLGTKAD